MLRHRKPVSQRRQNLPPRRGFTLVLVLGLLLVCVLQTQRIASRSLAAALAAIRSESDLQQRWGSWSIQRTLLADPEAVLSPLGSAEEEEVPRRTWEVVLSGQSYRVHLADESCKANLNTVYRDGGARAVETVSRSLQPAGTRLPVRLRPFSAGSDSRPLFDSWGQVFDQRSGDSLSFALIEATQQLTCWGDGRLNLLRAPAAVVETVLAKSLSASKIRALLQARRQHPQSDLSTLFTAAKLTRSERTRVSDRVTDESLTYSLWIHSLRPSTSVSGRLEFHVRSTSDPARRVESFVE
jgi:type II secretory pathway component PulK